MNKQVAATLKLPAEQNLVLKEAYRGGRCEIFGNPRAGEKILHFDFPGMYHSCLGGDFPIKKLRFCDKLTSIEQPGFYKVKLKLSADMPVLPVKRDRLLFPQGVVDGIF